MPFYLYEPPLSYYYSTEESPKMSRMIEAYENSSTSMTATFSVKFSVPTSSTSTTAMFPLHENSQSEINITGKGNVSNDLKSAHLVIHFKVIISKCPLLILIFYFIIFIRWLELMVIGLFLSHRPRYTRLGMDINVCDIRNDGSVWNIQQFGDHCGIYKNKNGNISQYVLLISLAVKLRFAAV